MTLIAFVVSQQSCGLRRPTQFELGREDGEVRFGHTEAGRDGSEDGKELEGLIDRLGLRVTLRQDGDIVLQFSVPLAHEEDEATTS